MSSTNSDVCTPALSLDEDVLAQSLLPPQHKKADSEINTFLNDNVKELRESSMWVKVAPMGATPLPGGGDPTILTLEETLQRLRSKQAKHDHDTMTMIAMQASELDALGAHAHAHTRSSSAAINAGLDIAPRPSADIPAQEDVYKGIDFDNDDHPGPDLHAVEAMKQRVKKPIIRDTDTREEALFAVDAAASRAALLSGPGFREADAMVRGVPLELEGKEASRQAALKAAEALLSGGPETPDAPPETYDTMRQLFTADMVAALEADLAQLCADMEMPALKEWTQDLEDAVQKFSALEMGCGGLRMDSDILSLEKDIEMSFD